jgi:hypothetical protein
MPSLLGDGDKGGIELVYGEEKKIFRTGPTRPAKPSVADPDPNPDPSDPYVLGLLDPDPLVRGMDPDLDPSIIKQKKPEIVRKTLIPTLL